MAGFRVRRRRDAPELEARDVDWAKRAGSSLIALDDRVRATADEVGFAEAELGPVATAGLSEALAEAHAMIGDAFRLNRLNHDAMPGFDADVRARYVRIVQLCAQAENLLDEQAQALADHLTQARRFPEILANVRADATRFRLRIPEARAIIEQLSARYAPEALADVAVNPAEAEHLLGFAEHSANVAERRRAAGQRGQATLALEASTDAVRQSEVLLDAVETFEVEALHAEARLAPLVERCRKNLDAAREAPQSRTVADAIAEAEAALADLPAIGVNTNPIAHLSQLRRATEALNSAVAAQHARTNRPVPLERVHRAIGDADRQLDVVRDLLAGHPGWVGAEAKTRLAESERIRADLRHYVSIPAVDAMVTDETYRAQAIAMAKRVADLAKEALTLARCDIDRSKRPRPERQARRGGGELRGEALDPTPSEALSVLP